MTAILDKSTLSEEEIAFSDIIGDLTEQWGFKRHLGSLWSLLYLRKQPMSPSQIKTELSLSAGNVNGLLSELQGWGVIRKVRFAQERSAYYEVEPQIWKSVTNVVKARELRILQEAIEGLKKLQKSLVKSPTNSRIEYQIDRVKHVHETLDTAFVLAQLMVIAEPSKISKLGKIIGRLRSL